MSNIEGGFPVIHISTPNNKGTIGAIYKRGNDFHLISAGHILGGSRNEIACGGVVIGSVLRNVKPPVFDYSIAQLNKEEDCGCRYYPSITCYGTINGFTGPNDGDSVSMFSRVLGSKIFGKIVKSSISIQAKNGNTVLGEQILIKPVGRLKSFGHDGDSGSLIFDSADKVVGLFIGLFCLRDEKKMKGDLHKWKEASIIGAGSLSGDPMYYSVANQFLKIATSEGLQVGDFNFKPSPIV